MPYRSRQRVADILAHREADRVPFDRLGDGEVLRMLEGMDLDADRRACYTEGDFQYLRFAANPSRERFADYLPGLPEDASLSDWGVAKVPLKSVEGFHAGHTTFHPLAEVNSVEELAAFPFPDMTEPWRHSDL